MPPEDELHKLGQSAVAQAAIQAQKDFSSQAAKLLSSVERDYAKIRLSGFERMNDQLGKQAERWSEILNEPRHSIAAAAIEMRKQQLSFQQSLAINAGIGSAARNFQRDLMEQRSHLAKLQIFSGLDEVRRNQEQAAERLGLFTKAAMVDQTSFVGMASRLAASVPKVSSFETPMLPTLPVHTAQLPTILSPVECPKVELEPAPSAAEAALDQINADYEAKCAELEGHPRRRVGIVAYIHTHTAIIVKTAKTVTDDLIEIIGYDPTDKSLRTFKVGVASVAWEIKVVDLPPNQPTLDVHSNPSPIASDKQPATLKIVVVEED